MEWVETTGRTIEEAKDAALDQLGVDESDAEFVVMSEPRTGLFGRVRGEARVRARVRPTQPRPKRSRNRRSERPRQETSRGAREGGRGGRVEGSGGEDQSVAVAAAEPAGTATATATAPAAAGGSGGGQGSGTSSSARRRRRRSRGGGGNGGGGGGASGGGGGGSQTEGAGSGNGRAEAAPAGDVAGAGRRAESIEEHRREADGKEEVVGEALSLQEQTDAAKEFVAGLVREFGLEATVTTELVDEDTARIAVDGEGLGILVGPGGATLAALQEVTRTYVQRHTDGQSDRILVDVAGYRAKRADALQRFTRQVAEEVLSSGTERALEPMSPPDRKVVHDTVNEIEGVSTRSEGEEPRRYIVISPAG